MTAVDTRDRAEADDGAGAAEAVRAPGLSIHDLAPAHLTSRIILFNFVGLLILAAGILYFSPSRDSLISSRVQSLMTQGHIMAAAIASSATIDTGDIVIDPDKLVQDETQGNLDPRSLDFLINPERAGPVLRRLVSSTDYASPDIRARIFDRDGALVVDSRYLYGRGDVLKSELPPLQTPEPGIVERWWKKANDWLFTNDYPVQKEYGFDNGKEFPEVTAALNGASVSVVRVNDKKEIVVSVAVPIQRFRAVLGTLVLSTQGGEIDDALRTERRIVFFTFLFAALVASLLAMSLAGHIAEPIRLLSLAAERVRKGVDNRSEIPDFTYRRDEIGHLSGALRDMTNALYRRIDAIEAFAADVSHELKNPLTSLRSAVETLQYAKNDEQRARLTAIVKDDVRRLDRLITDIADASRLDAELARNQARRVNVERLLTAMIEFARETRKPGQPDVRLEVVAPRNSLDRRKAFQVMGHDTRLGQVVRNLVDNAISFSPPGSMVSVGLRRLPREVEIRVEDEGPGLNPDHIEKIFERFYTDRPAGYFGKNSGLGLSISRQIVEAHGGTISAGNRLGPTDTDGKRPVLGARFIVRIPAAEERNETVAAE
ncbi:MAG: stimulus-sensing domain-containing protein [Hyphomicrobiales bacterium]